MGTGSSISSIDHNIFQKPYEPVSGLPVGRSPPQSYTPPTSSSLPPTPVSHPSHLSHYVPPFPQHPPPQQPSPSYGSYNSDNSQTKPPTFPSSYSTPQQHGYSREPPQQPQASPNIFYTPPSFNSMRPNTLPQPFNVKQEPQPDWGYDNMPPPREQGGYYSDYLSRKRKPSPCEMAYPEMSSSSTTQSASSNCGDPRCTSCPSSIPYLPSGTGSASYDPYNTRSTHNNSISSKETTSNYSQPNFSLKQEKKETLTTTVSTDGDGYRWRKYGRKSVKGSPYPRSYYKCTFSSCNVKKQVEMTMKDDKMVVKSCIYKGEHNHERPCITFAKAASQNAFKNAVIAGFVRHEKMLQGTGDVPRLSVETSKDVDFMDDGYRWRKYGQKYVKGSGYPRSYYKCTEKDCAVKKQVDQHGDRITNTYEGVHTHPPCANNSRKRRRTGEVDRLSAVKEIKEESENCPTPPGSSSESPRAWSEDEDIEPDGDMEDEEEELEQGQPVKIYGVAVDDEFDDIEGEFALDLKEFDKATANQHMLPPPPSVHHLHHPHHPGLNQGLPL